jgi:hypothetical protein
MALTTSGTVLVRIPKVGTIKLVTHGGRKLSISAPQACEITDRKGRPLFRRTKPRRPPT